MAASIEAWIKDGYYQGDRDTEKSWRWEGKRYRLDSEKEETNQVILSLENERKAEKKRKTLSCSSHRERREDTEDERII